MSEVFAGAAASETVRWPSSRFSTAAHLLLLLGATAGVFLAGMWDEGSIAAFLTVAGIALLVCPPRIQVDWKIWAAASALLLAASLALLPQSWFGAPAWRQQLLAAGVPLPATISVTPRETLYWLAILGIALCGVIFALAHPLRARGQLAFSIGIVVICGLYASLAIYARQTGYEFPFAPDPKEFGFFHNRNHTSTFLVTGCVVALGILGVAFRHRHWFAGSTAAVCLTICVAALIFFTQSRGGIVSLFAGTLLWIIGLGGAHRSKPLLISFATVLLGGILLLFSSAGVVSDRLVKLSGSVKERIVSATPDAATSDVAPLDGRVPIFRDTVGLIRDHAITGIGLGNFRYVFPMYRARALLEHPVLHPESDWLMLAAETGLPGLLASFLAIGLLLRSIWPQRSHPYWPLRWAILCAAFSAALHGFVDVPAHRVALGWWILALAALGFQAIPREPARPSRFQHLAFLVAGLGAVALGVFLCRAQWFGGPASPPLAAYEAEVEIIELRVGGKMPEALEAARRSIAAFPLADFLHFQRGATLRRMGREMEADAAFRVQRTIDSISTNVATAQANLWLETDPERTGALWLEALERRARIDRNESGKLQDSLGLFRTFLTKSASVPALQTRLLDASRIDHIFALEWLDQAAPALSAIEFPKLAGNAAFLAALTESQRLRFLTAWYRRGDRGQLFIWVAAQPDWQKTARPIALRRLADSGKFSEAIQTAGEQFDFNLDLAEPGGSEREMLATPPENPIAAFAYYWRIGNVVTARRILDEARADPAHLDPEIWRISAAMSAKDGHWDTAWQQVESYLRATHPGSFLLN